jgi:hypothetical protein
VSSAASEIAFCNGGRSGPTEGIIRRKKRGVENAQGVLMVETLLGSG